MRVVAGTARGVRLQSPPDRSVRPTGDRVKESMFNALVSMGAIEGARVLDLFAGSGALGIEALSRGAAHATFVDSSPAALAVVRTNLERCGFAAAATVVKADARRWCADHAARGGGRYDLALLDPPYDRGDWDRLLECIDAEVVVIESDRPVALPARYELRRDRRYGSTVVRIARLQESRS